MKSIKFEELRNSASSSKKSKSRLSLTANTSDMIESIDHHHEEDSVRGIHGERLGHLGISNS